MMMNDPRLDEIMRLMNPEPGIRPWFGGPSPVGCLRGVSCKQAAWKPPAARHGIWELVLHIAYWKYALRRNLEDLPRGGFPRSPSNWPRIPERPDERSWKRDRALLRAEHERLIDAVGAFDPRRLDDTAPGSGAYRFIDHFHGIVMHDVHHVAQIQLLKRMYRS
jgi:hypothetical protein